MTTVIKLLLTKLVKNAVSMMLTKKVALWALKMVVKQTHTKVDDICFTLVEGLYNGDEDVVMDCIEKLTKALKDKKE